MALLVLAFLSALGAVIALGNGNLIGVVMLVITLLLSLIGWSMWEYGRGPH